MSVTPRQPCPPNLNAARWRSVYAEDPARSSSQVQILAGPPIFALRFDWQDGGRTEVLAQVDEFRPEPAARAARYLGYEKGSLDPCFGDGLAGRHGDRAVADAAARQCAGPDAW